MSKFFGKAGARIKRMSDTNLLLVITIAVFFIMYIMAVLIVKGAFLKPQQFLNNLGNEAALIIASCGMSIVMIGGGIDISVGGMSALVGMCCAMTLDHWGGNIFTSILFAIGIGLAFGLVQGTLVAYLGI